MDMAEITPQHGPERSAILVVDDEEPILRLMEFQLAAKHHCVTVASAEAAFVRLEQERFDVVLTDVKLPGASGFEVCDFVRARCPATVMMMMTGMQGAVYARRAIEAGVFSFVTKPIQFGQLHTLIEAAIRHRALRQSTDAGVRRERQAASGGEPDRPGDVGP
jgi:DNA-binding NtrC family response regulator